MPEEVENILHIITWTMTHPNMHNVANSIYEESGVIIQREM